VNWNERLGQNFQSVHTQQLQNCGGRHREQNKEMPMMAGPSVPQEERVNWQERLEQGFQTRQAQRLQNHGGSVWEQNQQAFMRQQPGYRGAQMQLDHDREVLEHQAHVAELQWQQSNKDRLITTENLWNIKHVWLKCNNKDRLFVIKKLCNIKCIWQPCNSKGRLIMIRKLWSIKDVGQKCDN